MNSTRNFLTDIRSVTLWMNHLYVLTSQWILRRPTLFLNDCFPTRQTSMRR